MLSRWVVVLVRYACWLLSEVYIESDNVLNQTRRTEAFRHLSCYELGSGVGEMAASMAWSMLLRQHSASR